MIAVTDQLSLDEREIDESFIRASGPGGQNVNKVSTAVQLRFDVRRSPSLPGPIRARLEQIGGHLVTQGGVIVITARRSRSQEENRAEALARLIDLIRAAAAPVVPRRATRPTLASRRRRLDAKRRRSTTKDLRGGHRPGEE